MDFLYDFEERSEKAKILITCTSNPAPSRFIDKKVEKMRIDNFKIWFNTELSDHVSRDELDNIIGSELLNKLYQSIDGYPYFLKCLIDMARSNIAELGDLAQSLPEHSVVRGEIKRRWHEQMDDEESILYQLISVFRQNPSKDVIKTIAPKVSEDLIDENSALDRIDSLIRKNLIETLNGEQTLVIPSFSRPYFSHLNGDKRKIIHEEAGHYYKREQAKETTSDYKRGKLQLEAFHHYVQAAEYQQSLEILDDNSIISLFDLTLGKYALSELDGLRKHLQPSSEVFFEELITTLYRIGYLYELMGENQRATIAYSEVIDTITKNKTKTDQEIKAQRKIADSYSGLGITYCEQARMKLAIENYDRSIIIYKKLRDIDGTTAVCLDMGNLYRHLEDVDNAIGWIEAARRVNQYSQDAYRKDFNEAAALNNLGDIYCIIARRHEYECEKYLETAKINYEKCLEIGLKIKAAIFRNGAYLGLSKVHLALGLFSKALDYAQKSLEVAINPMSDLANNCDVTIMANQKPNDTFGAGLSYCCLAEVECAKRNWATAKKHLDESIKLLQNEGGYAELRHVYEVYSRVLTKQMEHDRLSSEFAVVEQDLIHHRETLLQKPIEYWQECIASDGIGEKPQLS